jgi:hypothetical protein
MSVSLSVFQFVQWIFSRKKRRLSVSILSPSHVPAVLYDDEIILWARSTWRCRVSMRTSYSWESLRWLRYHSVLCVCSVNEKPLSVAAFAVSIRLFHDEIVVPFREFSHPFPPSNRCPACLSALVERISNRLVLLEKKRTLTIASSLRWNIWHTKRGVKNLSQSIT